MTIQPCVLVTGVGGNSVGYQILQALLPLVHKYRIVTTEAEAFSFGLYQVKDRYVVPFANTPQYIQAILHIVEREKVNVILPGTEPEIRVLTDYRTTLEAAGCIVIGSPADVVSLCSNKWKLHLWLSQNKIGVPTTVLAESWRDLVDEVGFPIVGKPTENSGGSRNVAILSNEVEVERYRGDHVADGRQIVFQEYVGATDEEYTVGVLVSKTGELIDSIVVHRKLIGMSLATRRIIKGHTYALSTGYSQGVIIKHALIQRACEDVALKLGGRGPVNIQCRLIGDELKVFEVHPRFSGTSSIRAEVGFNEPDVLIRNFLLGEAFGRLEYQSNVAAIRALRNLIVPLTVMQNVPRISSTSKTGELLSLEG